MQIFNIFIIINLYKRETLFKCQSFLDNSIPVTLVFPWYFPYYYNGMLKMVMIQTWRKRVFWRFKLKYWKYEYICPPCTTKNMVGKCCKTGCFFFFLNVCCGIWSLEWFVPTSFQCCTLFIFPLITPVSGGKDACFKFFVEQASFFCHHLSPFVWTYQWHLKNNFTRRGAWYKISS